MGIVQGLHFEDDRLGDAFARPAHLAVKLPRDRRTAALACEAAVASSFTPEYEGLAPRHSSLPRNVMSFAHSCARPVGPFTPAEPIRQTAVA